MITARMLLTVYYLDIVCVSIIFDNFPQACHRRSEHVYCGLSSPYKPFSEVFMDRMFYPRSVVIFGVSGSPSNLGRMVVENMDRFRFQGTIYLVGGKPGTLLGRPVFTDIAEIPEIPDLAVFLIATGHLAGVLEACGRKGIRHAVIETGGFSEFEEDRKNLETKIKRIAVEWDIKILGPNCVGIVNVETGLALPFYPLNPEEAKKGPVSVISQSGGLIHELIILCDLDNMGLNKLISIGNKLMLDENDFLEYLISDPATKIIGLYLESISDGRRLMDLASRTDKPIVLLKANRNPGGREIAKFHTSALAGDDRVVDEAMKQAGIIRVEGLGEMINCFKAFSLPRPMGRRLVIMTRSGGYAVLSADSAYRHGFNLASLSNDFFTVLSGSTKAGVIRMTNPVDLGDVFDHSVHLALIEKALQEDGVDGVLFIHAYPFYEGPENTKGFVRSVAELSARYQKPVALCIVTHKKHWVALREASDFPIFTYLDEALLALSKSRQHNSRPTWRPGQVGAVKDVKKEAAAMVHIPAGMMAVHEALDLLMQYGLKVADYRVVKGIEEALEWADRTGYPVALKTASARVLHKTEEAGVHLNIHDGAALETAFHRLNAEAYLLQKMIGNECEVMIGGRNDRDFGPVILCGLGGTFVELYDDVAIRVAPVDSQTARDMMEGLRGAAILKGFRGGQSYDTEYLTEALVKISRLLADHREIKVVDINPLILMEKGAGGIIVDVKMEIG